MGPKATKIVEVARANPDWTQAVVARACGSTRTSVGVVLCRARKLGLIGVRPADARRYTRTALAWLPEDRRAEYKRLRSQYGYGPLEAQRIIERDMARSEEQETA